MRLKYSETQHPATIALRGEWAENNHAIVETILNLPELWNLDSRRSVTDLSQAVKGSPQGLLPTRQRPPTKLSAQPLQPWTATVVIEEHSLTSQLRLFLTDAAGETQHTVSSRRPGPAQGSTEGDIQRAPLTSRRQSGASYRRLTYAVLFLYGRPLPPCVPLPQDSAGG